MPLVPQKKPLLMKFSNKNIWAFCTCQFRKLWLVSLYQHKLIFLFSSRCLWMSFQNMSKWMNVGSAFPSVCPSNQAMVSASVACSFRLSEFHLWPQQLHYGFMSSTFTTIMLPLSASLTLNLTHLISEGKRYKLGKLLLGNDHKYKVLLVQAEQSFLDNKH